MERSATQQRHIDAPIEVVWELIGDPNRHPEWWPKMEETECAALEQGCRYRGVIKGLFGTQEHELLLERLDDCREVSIYCEATGVYTRFVLTEAAGGTFVEGVFGAQPHTLGMKVFTATNGRRYLQRWLAESLAALDAAASRAAQAPA
ncbi:MAG TPA: SRPBCC family protein [Thermoleophilaceae bacterium]